MQEEREERTKKMAEELSKLQQIHAHLAALEQMAASYPENHSTRLAIESLELYKARTVVEDDIVRLRGSLGYGTTELCKPGACIFVRSVDNPEQVPEGSSLRP
jgi:hypothetical protein